MKRVIRMLPQRRRVRLPLGFSMIEVLVTLLIISLALLGTAGLQAYAMRQNQNGQFRTQAVFLAADLAERMEANKAGATFGRYFVATTSTASTLNTACASSLCSSQDLANFDLSQWQNAISTSLPQSSWSVTHNGTAGVMTNPITYTITISWVDRRTDSTNTGDVGTGGTFSYVATRTVFQ